jgi:hypothetical protein
MPRNGYITIYYMVNMSIYASVADYHTSSTLMMQFKEVGYLPVHYLSNSSIGLVRDIYFSLSYLQSDWSGTNLDRSQTASRSSSLMMLRGKSVGERVREVTRSVNLRK